MAIPITGGATLYKGAQLARDGIPSGFGGAFFWGVVASGISGRRTSGQKIVERIPDRLAYAASAEPALPLLGIARASARMPSPSKRP